LYSERNKSKDSSQLITSSSQKESLSKYDCNHEYSALDLIKKKKISLK